MAEVTTKYMDIDVTDADPDCLREWARDLRAAADAIDRGQYSDDAPWSSEGIKADLLRCTPDDGCNPWEAAPDRVRHRADLYDDAASAVESGDMLA